VNSVIATQAGALAADLAGWRDLGAEVAAKQGTVADRTEAAVSALAARLVRLEASVADLDERSKALARAVGVEDGEEEGRARLVATGSTAAAAAAAAVSEALGHSTAAVGRVARRAMLGWPAEEKGG